MGLTATPTEPTAPTQTEPTADVQPRRCSLAALIGAAAVDDFLSNAFGRDAFRARMTPEAAGGLFGWPQLNTALAEHRLSPPRLRLEQYGGDVTAGVFRSRRTRRGVVLQDLDSAALTAKLRDGATLIVDAVNELSAPLQDLCSGLSSEFTAWCQTNLYACWGTAQGFDVHWDDHDVFVVQLAGRKRWALYGPTEASPTRRGAREPPAEPPPSEPELVVLEPGDVLYLPRGHWHAAAGLGGPTLHLTIGLTRKTPSDLLHWLADEMLSDPASRADLPFEAGDAAVAERVAAVLAALAQQAPADLARRYRRHMEAALPQRPQLSFPDIAADVALPPSTQLVLGQGPARLTRCEGGLTLSWRGFEFSLAPVLETSMRKLLAGEAVSVADIRAAAPTSSDEQIQRLLGELVRRGTLIPQGAAH